MHALKRLAKLKRIVDNRAYWHSITMVQLPVVRVFLGQLHVLIR